jgi:hypothetical protein
MIVVLKEINCCVYEWSFELKNLNLSLYSLIRYAIFGGLNLSDTKESISENYFSA